MRESDRVLSRRAFLKRSAIITAGVSAALIVGDEVFEELGRMFPRTLFSGWDVTTATYPNWSAAKVDTAGARLTVEMVDKAIAAIWRDVQPEIARMYTPFATPRWQTRV